MPPLTEMWCLEQWLQLFLLLSLSLSYSLIVFLSTAPALSLSCLSSSLLHVFFLVFFFFFSRFTHSFTKLSSFCSYFHLHASIPVSHSPPAIQLPPSPVILIFWHFKGNYSTWVPAQCFLKCVCLVGLQTECLLPVPMTELWWQSSSLAFLKYILANDGIKSQTSHSQSL